MSGSSALRRTDISWTPYGSTRGEPTVVLLVDHNAPSKAAVDRAARLAHSLEAVLTLVDVIPREGDNPEQSTLIAKGESNVDGTRCRVEVIHGEMREVALHRIWALRPVVVVVAGTSDPALACELVDLTRVPVLVARDPRPHGAFIAATSMRHLSLPVISIGLELAAHFDRPLLLFHNALPPRSKRSDRHYASIDEVVDGAAVAVQRRLDDVANVDERADSVVTRSTDTAAALLALASDRNADLVLIGRRERSWISRMFEPRLVEDTIERSQRSVLIVPIGEMS